MVSAAPSSNATRIVLKWTAPDGRAFTLQVSTDALLPPREVPSQPAPPVILPAPQAPPSPPAAPPHGPASTEQGGGYEQEVLRLTNIARGAGAVCGGQYFPPTAPLSPSSALGTAAELHSRDMGERNYFDHNSLDGRSPGDRIQATGFSARTWGENIYGGATTPAQAVDGWMKSPGHCKNIMDPHFRYLGVGYAHVPGSRLSEYWTQDFGG